MTSCRDNTIVLKRILAPSDCPGMRLEDNRLLRALPESDRKLIGASMELVPLRAGETLVASQNAPTYVHFPLNCLVSLVYTTQDGGTAEVAAIGCEGMVGFGTFVGGGAQSCDAIVQCGGFAYRIRTATLKALFDQSVQIRDLFMQFLQALLMQSSQTALCNRHHSVEQQLCRWLLAASDRLDSAHLSITHELIANTLGVRRAGISEAACKLQKEGLISYRRGRIDLLDRPRLERAACECYRAVKQQMHRLLPQVATRRDAPMLSTTLRIGPTGSGHAIGV